jgi:6-phosphogluconolactonase
MVALSGGTTPEATYRLLADPTGPGAGVSWPDVHVFWGDERHVPPDAAESNYRMAREALLVRVPVPAAQVHRIPAEMPSAEDAARAYERTLRAVFDLADGEIPAFDLILLGMGDDGHTASIFPGSAALVEAHRLVAAPWVEKFGASRITVTPPVLLAARQIVVLASGGAKAAVLREVIDGPFQPSRYPAQCLRNASGEVTWLVDEAAAAELSTAPGA